MLPALVVISVLALWWFARTSSLFVLSVRNGRVLLVQGRIRPGLLEDLRSVIKMFPTARGTIRATAAETHSRLSFSRTIPPDMQQRLRNVFGLQTTASLRSAPLLRKPTLGQLAGVAWLAWLFAPRDLD